MPKFIHHECIEAKQPLADDMGRFDVIETNEGFSVYEGGYLHTLQPLGSLDEARAKAQQLADQFDARMGANGLH